MIPHAERSRRAREREAQTAQLRDQGLTFKQIAQKLGVSPGRANQIYRTHIHREYWRKQLPSRWTDGLSVRVCNCLNNANISTRKQALAAIASGELRPNGPVRCYGWGSHQELCRYLGLPAPTKPVPKPVLCPHCGKNIKSHPQAYSISISSADPQRPGTIAQGPLPLDYGTGTPLAGLAGSAASETDPPLVSSPAERQ